MAFSNSAGCPEGWVRDEWMREVPRDVITGQFIDDAAPCDLPLAGFWILAAVLISARVFLGLVNLVVLRTIQRANKTARRKTRGLAPLFDIVNTVFVILFIGLSPVTSSRNGTSWFLFGFAFAPYFISGVLFLMKMIKNRKRMGGASGSSSGNHNLKMITTSKVTITDDKVLSFLLAACWLGIIGSNFSWILGAAAFDGNLVCHRVAIAFFTLMTSTSQLVAFSESVKTARHLSKHMEQTANVARPGALRSIRYKLLRTATVFAPTWIASTSILVCLAAGVLPFYWFIAFILMSMPVINATAATAMFFRKKKTARKEPPNPWKSRIAVDHDDDMHSPDFTGDERNKTLPHPSGMQYGTSMVGGGTMFAFTMPQSTAVNDDDDDIPKPKHEDDEADNKDEDAWTVTSVRQLDGIMLDKKVIDDV